MLKRAVRRAIGARKKTRDAQPSAPPPPSPKPAKPPSAAPRPDQPTAHGSVPVPTQGIAARIAAGDTSTAMPKVSATSGAQQTAKAEIHTTASGEKHWGPINNESARAKARGEKLVIDQWECISCGVCVENTDAVFVLPDDAKAAVKQQQGDMALIQDAVDSCPVTCIHWTDKPARYEQLNDTEGNPL